MESRRRNYARLVAQLKAERDNGWLPHWREIADVMMPRRSRFLVSDRNDGRRRNTNIIDSTATYALRTLSSGMHSGLTSPARPWFRLTTPDPRLAELGAVKEWLSGTEQRMRDVFAKSNIYDVLPILYTDLGWCGTACSLLLEDEEDVIRAYSFPVGSYMLACSARGVVDTAAREYSMTVRQVVARFKIENCSANVKTQWDNNNREAWVDVVHVISPNDLYDDGKLEAKHKPWNSCYFEAGTGESDDKFLLETGFDEFPILAPRWDVTGEDVYGRGPGMDALQEVLMVQTQRKRYLQAVEKGVNPPLIGPSSLANTEIYTTPGKITYSDEREGQKGLRPLYETNFRLEPLGEDIRQVQQVIKQAFFADLFLMFNNSDRTQITAEEIRAKQQEKMLMLGPVLERLNDELFAPLINRTFAIMLRRNLLPEPPQELQGVDLKIEYISVLASAQRMLGASGIQQLAGYVATYAPLVPSMADKFDWDQSVDELGDMLGVKPNVIRTDEAVAQIRDAQAQQQAKQQQMMNAEMASKTAKNLSSTPMDGDTALSRIAQAAQQEQVA